MIMFKFICAITVIFLINGCIYTDYTGFYHLSRDSENFANRPATADELNFIEKSVKNIAVEFGFLEADHMEWQYSNTIFFTKRPTIKTKYDHLNGFESIIGIYLLKDPGSISITIKDWKNTSETDFVKTLKARLEKELGKEIDMKKVRFRRKGLSLT